MKVPPTTEPNHVATCYIRLNANVDIGYLRFKKPHPELDIEAVIAHARKTPPNIGLTMLFMDIFGVDRRPALAKIDRPTLVIGSAESSLAEAQKKMAAAIPGAELLLLKGVGHAVFVDEPEIFAQALERLLSRPIG